MVVVGGACFAIGPSDFGRPGTLTVSPVFQSVELKADQAAAKYSVKISNKSTVDQEFVLSAQDFGTLDESGGVAFLGLPAKEIDHRYGLASWMKLDQDLAVVPAGSSVDVVVTVDNRASLAPGGHYGAVLATAVTDPNVSAKEPRVGLKEVLSSLFLLAKAGGIGPNLALVSQIAGGGWWHLPSSVDMRFNNTGDVHAVPRGVVELRDMAGRVVARGALNESSGVILPGAFRRYETPFVPVARAWMPGRYRIVTTYRPDGMDQSKILVTMVWYAGAWWVWLAVAGILVAAGGLVRWLKRGRRKG